jgi:hypothetical protein
MLRSIAGLSPKSSDQGAGAMSSSWSFCHVIFAETTVVAMGRTIGDGGWYFHVYDMATHPDHQRKASAARFSIGSSPTSKNARQTAHSFAHCRPSRPCALQSFRTVEHVKGRRQVKRLEVWKHDKGNSMHRLPV